MCFKPENSMVQSEKHGIVSFLGILSAESIFSSASVANFHYEPILELNYFKMINISRNDEIPGHTSLISAATCNFLFMVTTSFFREDLAILQDQK